MSPTRWSPRASSSSPSRRSSSATSFAATTTSTASSLATSGSSRSERRNATLLMRRLLPALFALSAPAFAWGPEGHRVVGDIASRYLTATARAQVSDLLRNDRLAGGEPSGRRTLGEIANWADEIKDFEWGKRRGSWHYDDIPLCGTPEYGKYCRGGRCASAQLARQIEVLSDPRARPRARNEALKWVVHLIGDIHQPLHAANHGDRGGNQVQVSFFGERDNPPYGSLNLHAVWDVRLVARLRADRRQRPEKLGTGLDLRLDRREPRAGARPSLRAAAGGGLLRGQDRRRGRDRRGLHHERRLGDRPPDQEGGSTARSGAERGA